MRNRQPEQSLELLSDIRDVAAYGALAFATVLAIGDAPSAEARAQGPYQGPQNGPLTPLVEQAIRRDTVLIESLGCSGRLLRSTTGEVIGAITAVHCLETDEGTRKGSNGQKYIVLPKPIAAKTGLNGYKLKTAAVLDRFVVANEGDPTHDIALGVDEDSNPSEVIASYRKQALPPKELTKMRRGDKIFTGSWPDYQPRGIPGKRRQGLILSITGFGRAQFPDGTYPLLNTEVSSTGDGGRCSPQSSGSVVFRMVRRKPRSIGVVMLGSDLRGDVPQSSKNPTPKIPSLQGGNDITATCSISYESVPLRQGAGMILNVVRSAKEIPGYVSPEVEKAEFLAKARAQIKDPNTPKTRIEGIVQIITDGKRKQPEKNPDQNIFIENPMLLRDASTQQSVLAWASPSDPDNLQFHYISTDDELFGNVYITPRNPKPSLISSPGALTYQPNANGGSEFIDSKGLKIGSTVPTMPNQDTGIYVLDLDNKGRLIFITQNINNPAF